MGERGLSNLGDRSGPPCRTRFPSAVLAVLAVLGRHRPGPSRPPSGARRCVANAGGEGCPRSGGERCTQSGAKVHAVGDPSMARFPGWRMSRFGGTNRSRGNVARAKPPRSPSSRTHLSRWSLDAVKSFAIDVMGGARLFGSSTATSPASATGASATSCTAPGPHGDTHDGVTVSPVVDVMMQGRGGSPG